MRRFDVSGDVALFDRSRAKWAVDFLFTASQDLASDKIELWVLASMIMRFVLIPILIRPVTWDAMPWKISAHS